MKIEQKEILCSRSTFSILFFSAETEITGFILGADWRLKEKSGFKL